MSDLSFGLTLTLYGMGLVFALLGLLWAFLVVVGKIDANTPISEPADERPATARAATAADPGAFDPDILAAIALAVVAHVEARRRQAAPEMRTTVPGSQIFASRWMAAGRTRQTRSWQPKR